MKYYFPSAEIVPHYNNNNSDGKRTEGRGHCFECFATHFQFKRRRGPVPEVGIKRQLRLPALVAVLISQLYGEESGLAVLGILQFLLMEVMNGYIRSSLPAPLRDQREPFHSLSKSKKVISQSSRLQHSPDSWIRLYSIILMIRFVFIRCE